MPKQSFTLAEAQKKLEHYCAYQERCHLEVRTKLTSLGMIPLVQDEIITRLVQNNYLNESRFAQSFVRGKFRFKKWGKERIVRELQQRQITSYNIQLGLKEIEPMDYQETFTNLILKFWRQYETKPYAIRKKKVFDALKYRGWESEMIWNQLANIERLKKDE